MRIWNVLVGFVVSLCNDTLDGLEALDQLGLSLLFDLQCLDVLARSIGIGEDVLFALKD